MRLLIVDDSAVYRKILTKVLETFDDIDEIISAPNGNIALSKAEISNPEVITLDVEMPGIDGIETLKRLKANGFKGEVVMVSALTKEGAEAAIKAIEFGAIDIVAKPDSKDMNESIKQLTQQLKPILDGIIVRHTLKSKTPKIAQAKTALQAPGSNSMAKPQTLKRRAKPEVVAIGASTGGPQALTKILTALPANLSVPVLITLHMPPMFTAQLAETIDRKSHISVVEASNGQQLKKGTAYLAPGGKHMKVNKNIQSNNVEITISDDPPEEHCKPSVNYLFRSVSSIYKDKALGVILTGMGADGVRGLRRMKRYNINVIAQDEESCVVFGMPMEAIKAGLTDIVLPLDKIANKIAESVG